MNNKFVWLVVPIERGAINVATETEEKIFSVEGVCLRVMIAGVIYAAARAVVDEILPGFWGTIVVLGALVLGGLAFKGKRTGVVLLHIATAWGLYLMFKWALDLLMAIVVIIAIVVLLARFNERP